MVEQTFPYCVIWIEQCNIQWDFFTSRSSAQEFIDNSLVGKSLILIRSEDRATNLIAVDY